MTVAATMPANGAIVVTGGGSGIGRALVLALVAQPGGAIIVADRNLAAAQETAAIAGDRATAVELDVADRAAVDRVAADHDPIAAWFSNAGIHTSDGLGAEAEWHRALDVNLLAHVHAAHAVLPAMEVRGSGIFVITASAAGLLMDLRTATYTASKHAAVGLAEWLAVSVADGVSIHCVCPEGVRTAMTRADSAFSAAGITFLSAEQVATSIMDGVARGNFMILTHAGTPEFERRRTGDRPRWLAGMRRAKRSALDLDRIFPLQTGQ